MDASGRGPASILKISSRNRSGEIPGSRAVAAFINFLVSRSIKNPKAAARRTARRIRIGSLSKAACEQARIRFSRMSFTPPRGSIISPLPISIATALIVKSRPNKSASSESPRYPEKSSVSRLPSGFWIITRAVSKLASRGK